MKKGKRASTNRAFDNKSNLSQSLGSSKGSKVRPSKNRSKLARVRGSDGFESVQDYFTTPGNRKSNQPDINSYQTKSGLMSSHFRLSDQTSQRQINKSARSKFNQEGQIKVRIQKKIEN